MASESFWWCYRCQARVDSAHVTFSEHHDGCGGGCEVLDDEPDVFAAARAWQAFRDWLNGVGDRVLIEGATFKGPRPGAWLTIDPKTGVQTLDLRGATITYGGKDD